jgi:hypoxanthine phosphoribosyltransferase
MVEIMKNIKIPVTMDYIMMKSYYKDTYSSNVKIYKDVDLEISGRHIIIIEDIIDTGKTLKKIADIFKTRDIASIAYMTLIEKNTKVTEVEADFVGFKLKDQFLVG